MPILYDPATGAPTYLPGQEPKEPIKEEPASGAPATLPQAGPPPEEVPEVKPPPEARVASTTQAGKPEVLEHQGKKYYAPDSQMYKMGFRTEEEYLKAQQYGATYGPHPGESVPEKSVIVDVDKNKLRYSGEKSGPERPVSGAFQPLLASQQFKVPIKVTDASGNIKEKLIPAKEYQATTRLKGEAQFHKMVKLGVVPKGSAFISKEKGEWSYLPPQQAEKVEKAKKEYDAYIDAQQKIAKYTEEEGTDIASYLRANPGDTKTLKDAGFSDEAIRDAATYNTYLAKLAPYKDESGYDLAKFLRRQPNDESALKEAGFQAEDIQRAKEDNKTYYGIGAPDYQTRRDFQKDYFKDKGWQLGINRAVSTDKQLAAYDKRLYEANQAYDAIYTAPTGSDTFTKLYFEDRGWNYDRPELVKNYSAASGVKAQSNAFANLVEYDKRMLEARDAYTSKYGAKAVIETGTGTMASFVFLPAGALRPDVKLSDIEGKEWTIGGAQVALIAAPIVAAPFGKLGAALARGTQAAAGGYFAYETGKGIIAEGKLTTPLAISAAFDAIIMASVLRSASIKLPEKIKAEFITKDVETWLSKSEAYRPQAVKVTSAFDKISRGIQTGNKAMIARGAEELRALRMAQAPKYVQAMINDGGAFIKQNAEVYSKLGAYVKDLRDAAPPAYSDKVQIEALQRNITVWQRQSQAAVDARMQSNLDALQGKIKDMENMLARGKLDRSNLPTIKKTLDDIAWLYSAEGKAASKLQIFNRLEKLQEQLTRELNKPGYLSKAYLRDLETGKFYRFMSQMDKAKADKFIKGLPQDNAKYIAEVEKRLDEAFNKALTPDEQRRAALLRQYLDAEKKLIEQQQRRIHETWQMQKNIEAYFAAEKAAQEKLFKDIEYHLKDSKLFTQKEIEALKKKLAKKKVDAMTEAEKDELLARYMTDNGKKRLLAEAEELTSQAAKKDLEKLMDDIDDLLSESKGKGKGGGVVTKEKIKTETKTETKLKTETKPKVETKPGIKVAPGIKTGTTAKATPKIASEELPITYAVSEAYLKPLVETKPKLIIAPAITTRIKEAQKIYPAPNIYQKPEPSKAPQPIPKRLAQALKLPAPSPKPQPKPIPAPTPQPQPKPKPQPIPEIPKPKLPEPEKPPPEVPIKSGKGKQMLWTKEEIESAVAWRPSPNVIRAIKAPYSSNADIASFSAKNAPAGLKVLPMFSGKGMAQKSARVIQGKAPSRVTIDDGIMDVVVSGAGGRKPRISSTLDRHQRTTSQLTTKGTGLRNISQRRGKRGIFRTRMKGGTVLSRVPLRGM